MRPRSEGRRLQALLDDIERLIPTIVFEVKDVEGRDIANVKVSMDGQKLVDRLDGSALEVDLGDHEFAFEANGQVAKQHFLMREGDKARRERVTVGEAKAPATIPTPPLPVTTVPPDTKPAGGTDTATMPAPPTPPDSASTGTGQRVAGGVVAGLGVVGAAVGTVFVVMGNSANNDYGASLCPTGQGTTCQAAADKKSEINSDWLIGGISLGVGGAALITGAIVFFTAPSGKNSTASWQLVPSVGPGSAGLLFTSTF